MMISWTVRLLRLSAIERLLRFQARKFGLSEPPTHLAKKVIERNRSPGTGALDLDDVGAHVGQQLRRKRPLQQMAEIEDGDAVEGLVHGIAFDSDEVGHEARRGGEAAVDAEIDAGGKAGGVAREIDAASATSSGLPMRPIGMHLDPGARDMVAKLRDRPARSSAC